MGLPVCAGPQGRRRSWPFLRPCPRLSISHIGGAASAAVAAIAPGAALATIAGVEGFGATVEKISWEEQRVGGRRGKTTDRGAERGRREE